MNWGRLLIFPVLWLIASPYAASQDPDFQGVFAQALYYNPAFAGSSENPQIQFSYLNKYPSLSQVYETYYFSYDQFIPVMHGGAGISLFTDRNGPYLRFSRLSANYSYHLQAGREFFVLAGFQASLALKSYAAGDLILPDQLDPLSGILPGSSETFRGENHSYFDMMVGFVFQYRSFLGGISADHMAEPSPGTDYIQKRRYHFQAVFTILERKNETFSFHLRSSLGLLAQHPDNLFTAALEAGTGFGGIRLGLRFSDTMGFTGVPIGLILKVGEVQLHYTYSLLGGGSLLAGNRTLAHQAGLRIGLQSVHKSHRITTINFPNL